MSNESVDLGRRKVLTAGAVAVLASPLAAAGVASAKGTDAPAMPPGTPSPKSAKDKETQEAAIRLAADAPVASLEVFAPLSPGDEVAFDWVLREVRAPEKGAMLVVLSKAGKEARIHVCANAGCAVGPASTEALDFVIMNDGSGDEPTDEELGLALVALAGAAAKTGVVPKGLLTHEQRIEKWLGEEPGALL